MHLYKIILGDWSRDGHNQTAEYLVRCNKTPKEFAEGLKTVDTRLGFELRGRLCRDYEDRYIRIDLLDRILKICPDDTHRNSLLGLLEPSYYYNLEVNPYENWSEGELNLEIYNSLPKEVKLKETNKMLDLKFGIDLDSYVEFVMLCVKIAIPDMVWEDVEVPTLFKGFGYGLFD